MDPISNAEAWHHIVVASIQSPGAIAVNGMRGFKRETGWDKKKGKGSQGASLTTTTFPPAEGQITFQLWLARHFTEWEQFLPLLKYNPAKTSTNDAADALDIFHPALVFVDVGSVVTHFISPPYHRGRGLYEIEVDFVEWLPPPPVAIVRTTGSSSANDPSKAVGDLPDPIGDAKDRQADALGREAGLIGNPQEGPRRLNNK